MKVKTGRWNLVFEGKIEALAGVYAEAIDEVAAKGNYLIILRELKPTFKGLNLVI